MNLITLHKYYEEGWLIKQTHPTLPLTIWNYSQNTQFERNWDDVTIHCRGLVTDDEGNVVARPFKKFFNIEEGEHTPTKDFSVYEKMDGSLGILFNYKGEWIFASRGSFTSDQCEKGIEMMNDTVNERMVQPLHDGYTYMFEIIYRENRIVVDYGDYEGLVMLGAIHTITGEETPYQNLVDLFGYSYDIVKQYHNIRDYHVLKSIIDDNQEGFVIHFENGDRCKIKGDEYLRLHKIMTEISTKSVWECLSSGDDIYKLLEDVPDEFFNKIEEYVDKLEFEYMLIEAKCLLAFNQHGGLPKKEFAEQVKWNKYSGILFRMYDGKDYVEAIWRKIKPEYRKL
jgi:T4 RnlA family RNA ligase